MADAMDKRKNKNRREREKDLMFFLRVTMTQRCYRRHTGITEHCGGICCSARLEIEITHRSQSEGRLHKTSV